MADAGPRGNSRRVEGYPYPPARVVLQFTAFGLVPESQWKYRKHLSWERERTIEPFIRTAHPKAAHQLQALWACLFHRPVTKGGGENSVIGIADLRSAFERRKPVDLLEADASHSVTIDLRYVSSSQFMPQTKGSTKPLVWSGGTVWQLYLYATSSIGCRLFWWNLHSPGRSPKMISLMRRPVTLRMLERRRQGRTF